MFSVPSFVKNYVIHLTSRFLFKSQLSNCNTCSPVKRSSGRTWSGRNTLLLRRRGTYYYIQRTLAHPDLKYLSTGIIWQKICFVFTFTCVYVRMQEWLASCVSNSVKRKCIVAIEERRQVYALILYPLIQVYYVQYVRILVHIYRLALNYYGLHSNPPIGFR